MTDVGVAWAPPAEVGALHHGRPERRHLAAAVLDLAARGHLTVQPIPTSTDGSAHPRWRIDVASRPVWSPSHGLSGHEVRLLDSAAGAPNGDLEALFRGQAVPGLLASVRDDAVARGWLHSRRSVAGRRSRRTAVGREVLDEVRVIRRRMTTAFDELDGPSDLTWVRERLPLAVAFAVPVPWEALQRRRAPLPEWFRPGRAPVAHGWFGLQDIVTSTATGPGGGLNWDALAFLGLVPVS